MASKGQEGLSEEKLYVGQFTTADLPQSYTSEDPDYNGLPRHDYPIPKSAPFEHIFGFKITHVVHSTHMMSKKGICGECEMEKNEKTAMFQANRKKPSKFCRKSYILKLNDEEWIPQPPTNGDKNLLPGNYVWFSMKPDLPKDSNFNPVHYPVPYVDGTTFYGPWSFMFEYRQLIRNYRKNIHEGAHVVLRKGGTLMFKREVCYVVIITNSNDTTHDDETFPLIKEGETADEVLELGNKYTIPPTFHPKCVPPPPKYDPSDREQNRWKGYEWKQLQHYDQVVFAVHCSWKVNSLKMDLPDGQPKCFFSDPQYSPHDKEAYCQFHPVCLSQGNIARGIPECYNKEFELWKKEQEAENMVAECPPKRRKK